MSRNTGQGAPYPEGYTPQSQPQPQKLHLPQFQPTQPVKKIIMPLSPKSTKQKLKIEQQRQALAVRAAAGQEWADPTLLDWDESISFFDFYNLFR